VCKAEEIFSFDESKEKMGTPKKQKLFNAAMYEIQNRPNIEAPVVKDSPPEQGNNNKAILITYFLNIPCLIFLIS
jgi:hypothetical protein